MVVVPTSVEVEVEVPLFKALKVETLALSLPLPSVMVAMELFTPEMAHPVETRMRLPLRTEALRRLETRMLRAEA